MAKAIHTLTAEEVEIFNEGVYDPNITLGYLFKREGVEQSFQLDYNFTEAGKWQKQFCMASETFIVVVAGIGTGKTLGVGLSAFYHSVQTPGFKFLNVARESWQSQLMYSLILENVEGTNAEKFITGSPKRPYPSIIIEYMVGRRRVKSTLEFMSLGEQGDATNIFSWRGDWINLEEAGRIDGLATIVANLSTRLTGATAENRPFLGRMSLISNPWENPELWQMLDIATADKKSGLALEIETKENKNVTDDQLSKMLALIPEKDRERYTTGKRPEGRGTYFPKNIVEPCEDLVLSEKLTSSIKEGLVGYVAHHFPRIGYYHFEMPPAEGRVYYMIGDPGTGNAPARNAPVWMIFDVTEAPSLITVQALWWGSGDGSISPFIGMMLEWIERYKPIVCGIDNTSTQKNMAEIITMEYLTGKKMSVDKLVGFDFSGTKRFTYLVCLKLSLENQNLRWPSIVAGIGSQLQNYDPLLDKGQSSKLPQDIVATLSMAMFKVRSHFGSFTEMGKPNLAPSVEQAFIARRSGREYNARYRDPRRFAGKTKIKSRGPL